LDTGYGIKINVTQEELTIYLVALVVGNFGYVPKTLVLFPVKGAIAVPAGVSQNARRSLSNNLRSDYERLRLATDSPQRDRRRNFPEVRAGLADIWLALRQLVAACGGILFGLSDLISGLVGAVSLVNLVPLLALVFSFRGKSHHN
jgi:hypothetical protein